VHDKLTVCHRFVNAEIHAAASMALARKQAIPTERPPLVGEVSANFADRGCRVVSAKDAHGR
jgi:hypothetical protein